MIHRAMAGSIERFTAILCEHFAGKWPFWLSPRQVIVIPVGMGFLDYAKEVAKLLKQGHFYAGMYPPCMSDSTPGVALFAIISANGNKQMSTAPATRFRRRFVTASLLNVSTL